MWGCRFSSPDTTNGTDIIYAASDRPLWHHPLPFLGRPGTPKQVVSGPWALGPETPKRALVLRSFFLVLRYRTLRTKVNRLAHSLDTYGREARGWP